MAVGSTSSSPQDVHSQKSIRIENYNDPKEIHRQLQESVYQLSIRGLKVSAAWAAELTTTISFPTTEPTTSRTQVHAIDDTFMLAKMYFDLGEYRRAARVLGSEHHSPGGKTSSNGAHYFLRAYALFLAGERTKQEHQLQEHPTNVSIANTSSVASIIKHQHATNPELRRLYVELSERYENRQLDGFGLYLFGVVLMRMNRKRPPPGTSTHETMDHHLSSSMTVLMHNAQDILLESVQMYPWNWSAWTDLASCFEPTDNIDHFFVTKHCSCMFDFFHAHVLLEQQHSDRGLEILNRLARLFPTSSYVTAQQALAQYNVRNFDTAQEKFESVAHLDPYRIDNLDVYSNVLYVKESKAELSRLAHTAVQIDKYRPETCCVIGNYYSLKAKHERAVLYFQRALRLNPNFLAAWTLIGHEYVELKNTGAAIEAYRQAVDINPRDYRAWYGLGQAYEILQMELYALYYYRKTTTLRCFDSRMWCALAGCYQRLDRQQEAILCYERAMSNYDREGLAAVHLARLYRDVGSLDQAARYFSLHLDKTQQWSGSFSGDGQDTIEAILFMAHYLKDKGQLRESQELCNRLLDRPGPEKDEAKAILREIQSLEENNHDNKFMMSSSMIYSDHASSSVL